MPLQTRALGTSQSWMSRIRRFVVLHTVASFFIGLAILGGAYFVYAKATAPSTAPTYILGTVATDTIVATLTESGQVSATTNVDLEAKASGEVLSVPVSPGDTITAGTAIAYIDPTTAEKEVRDAKANLESAQIALQKLQEPADAVSTTDAQNAVASAQTSSYDDITSTFLDMPVIVSGLDGILHNYQIKSTEENENAYADLVTPFDSSALGYEQAAETAFGTADNSYLKAIADFKATPRSADGATIDALAQETYQATADLSDALKAATTFLSYVDHALSLRNYDIPTLLPSQIATLTTYTNEADGHIAALSGDTRTSSAATASLAQLQQGADPLDVESSQLAVTKAQNALADAETDLANTVVRAPFTGLVAKVPIQKFETIGSGSTVATMVSAHQSAVLSLNEVDAAQIAVGQKATLTFDALPNVTIAGTVASIDSLGTVSQGVVTYNATITFDTDNPDVKAGMSANASIIIATKNDVLAVPTSAVKSQGGQSYVEAFNPPLNVSGAAAQTAQAPVRVPVTTGISSDTETEIVSGLSVGEQIVVRTSATGSAAATPTTSGPRGFGGGGGIRLGG